MYNIEKNVSYWKSARSQLRKGLTPIKDIKQKRNHDLRGIILRMNRTDSFVLPAPESNHCREQAFYFNQTDGKRRLFSIVRESETTCRCFRVR